MEKDPFDLFLERCIKEIDEADSANGKGTKEIAEEICHHCLNPVLPGSRYCSLCGSFQEVPQGVSSTFKPRTLIKRRLAISLISVERNYEIGGQSYTRVHLKIRNLSSSRAHISLTYVDSVLIDLTGRQFSSVESDEFPEGVNEPVFPTWFYIYPEAYRDGVLLFRESPVPLQKAIICTMHQENEDELFVFDLDIPPRIQA